MTARIVDPAAARVAIVGLTVSFGYFFLLDKAEYLNHFYLVLLFLILLCMLPAHRCLSTGLWQRSVYLQGLGHRC